MNKMTVTFKETYMPKTVTRTCINMSRAQIIKTYGLDSPDIEWYKFEEVEDD